MLEPKKPGQDDGNDLGSQSGTTQKDQKPGFGEQAPDQPGLTPKDTPPKE